METTGRHLVDHWSWAAEKGLMNKNTAGALRAACAQVLSVVDDWENVDVRTLDLDDVARRFQNLRKKDFMPKSLEEYKRRFKQAVNSYLSYVEDPGAWRPHAPERSRGERRPEARGSGRDQDVPQSSPDAPARAGVVDYPFPLRDGHTARLILPRDLKMAEVKRLFAFMSTLAVDNTDI